jgi:hypothetical protein
MDFNSHAEINQLLVKAGRLRRAATANSMAAYRPVMLRVARELEARAAALQIDLERRSSAQKNIFPHLRTAH